ncbi:hypothetical protein [Polaribacter sp. SA4-12]|uniref:hypothetical protein n=1 Tax=Polaribacter sp. SA4-12 TaxID=1312072 RepID=UPI000B3C24DC|nr:hypothetical protein [Polaribacter sp. SA4-12]ARV14942.1 hypothetical protein BTO07_07180 [Polaribacter sp. SA4-12]
MKNDYKDTKFQKLLNKLQQESWQLELLISGFAIFGLISSLAPLKKMGQEAAAVESYTKAFFFIASIACMVLIVNLVIHVILRGLWIGAIGLRYVSGEIDYDALNYRKRFTNHLKNKVGSFDKYIGTLENYCSILFAVTFLYLFYIISFFIIFVVLFLAGSFFIESGIFPEYLGMFLLGIFALFFMSLSFIVFIDFVTQGYLKKKEWTSFLYLPLYKIFSVLTLSFLYRPLVYNFLDNKFGRRLLFVLFPVYLFTFYISTVNHVRSNFVEKQSYSSVNYASNSNYLNAIENSKNIRYGAIQSKIITNSFLKVFIPFRTKTEDILIDQNLNLKPIKDERGYVSSFFRSQKRDKTKDSLQAVYLNAFKKMYLLKIDSLQIQSDYIVTEINNQLGFEAIFPIHTIVEGKHTLKISRFVLTKKSKELENEEVIEIPFWYYKQ